MADPKDDDRDEEWFKEVYGKEYTGPVRPSSENAHDNSNMKKRSIADAGERDDDDAPPDPNAVPTDFTSREAKVWEAKAKAIERNWKKKKEEELICRICGEYGHFSQGCPTTLGVNRRQAEVVEKVPVKDKRLKPRIIGTSGSTIQGIEKDTGCRLKLEDNLAAGNGSFFVRITGSSRVMVGKAVDAVKRLIDQVQDDRKPHHSRRSSNSHHRGHTVSPMASSQMPRMSHDPNLAPYPGQEGGYYDDGRHNNLDQMRQMEARRPWETVGQNGAFPMGGYGQKGGSQYDDRSIPKSDPREDDRGPESEGGFDQQSSSIQTIQALEHSFVQETMQLTKELNDAEDMENARHREAMRDIQEKYQQKMASLRAAQAKRREEFLRQDAQFRQQQYQQYQQPQSGLKYYNYDMSGPTMAGGLNNGPRDQQLGYGVGSSDRADALGGGAGYGFRGEGGYYNPQHSYRNSGYESGNVHMGNQGYDAGQYRY